ncbi:MULTISPECIES: hypothetical protein [unclassified Rhizobium]|uniref:hypothetical protein n=1 Tax=unclassified Rhizobium TaxID=2613769 RepID=UPI0006FEA713|nr:MULTISPECIES: hypothetical protein [unclassified Rhizobium]KQV43709.1 hypothetical protein ASC86_02560 [Rhizobium sp. Root1212]KRD37893.1 hypothetical protein ASE37_02560 [Rhizobium sp. Root268]
MDVFNIGKSIEKLIFELLMWLIFYPYTLLRVIFQPNHMMAYARAETLRDENVSFDSGMKPSIFLFLSIVIAAFIAPVSQAELASAGQTATGQYISASWLNLIFFRVVIYSIFPITSALIYDLITPGPVTRLSLQIPFNQQCYISAPFAMITSLTMVMISHTENLTVVALLFAAQCWLLLSNYFFFRSQGQQSRLKSAGLSFGSFVLAWGVFLTVTNIALRYKGID